MLIKYQSTYKYKKFPRKVKHIFKKKPLLTYKKKILTFYKTARVNYKLKWLPFKNFYNWYNKYSKIESNNLLLQQNQVDFKLLCYRRFNRYKNLKLKRKIYPKMNSKYYWLGPKKSLEYAFPPLSQSINNLKNFYHKRFNQMPPNQYFRKRILAHYYLRYARYTLFFQNKKKRDILNNFFSLDRKLLKIYAHRVEKFLYKRFPYKTHKFKTNFYFPNYSNYRYLFKNQIREQHTFRWLYRLSYKQFVKMFKKTTFYTKRKFEYVFLKYLELRLDTAIYRLNMAFSLKQARQWVKKHLFLVNGVLQSWPKFQLNVGDIIIPIKELRTQSWPQQEWTVDHGINYNSTRLFWRPIQMDQYPAHFLLNERIPAALVVTNPNLHKVYNIRPLSIQFLTLSLLKYS